MDQTAAAPQHTTAQAPSGVAHALILALALRASMFLLPLLSKTVGLPREGFFEAGPKAWAVLAVLAVVQCSIVYFGLFKLGQVRASAIGWTFESKAHLARLAALGCAGFIAITALLYSAGQLDPSEVAELLATRTLLEELFYVCIGCLAAFGEESVFRGYLQPALQARLGFAGGIFACAALFSLLHFRFDVVSLAGKLALGLVFGLLRGRQRSLYAPAVAHALTWAVLGSY